MLDFGGRPGGDGAAEVQDRHPLAEVQDHPHLVLDEDDGQRNSSFNSRMMRIRSSASDWFMPAAGSSRSSSRGPLIRARAISTAALLPVRQMPGRGLGIVAQLKRSSNSKARRVRRRSSSVKGAAAAQGVQQTVAVLGEGPQADVVQDAQVLEEPDILKGPGNAGGGDAVGGPGADVLALER